MLVENNHESNFYRCVQLNPKNMKINLYGMLQGTMWVLTCIFIALQRITLLTGNYGRWEQIVALCRAHSMLDC